MMSYGCVERDNYMKAEGVELAIDALDEVINGFEHTGEVLVTSYFYLMVARNKLLILKEEIENA